MNTTPKPYQKEGVKLVQEFNGRALIADDTGLGKTFESLYWAWKYLPADPPGPVVIVCPAHLKIHWQREARKHLGMRVEILGGATVPELGLGAVNRNQAYVINYEVLEPPRRDDELPDETKAWWHRLSGMRPRLVIGDEAHFVKTKTSARSTAFRRLCRGVPHVLLLTGTPVTNRPADLWPLLNIIDPVTFNSQFAFNMEYSNPAKVFGQWKFVGSKNLDQLHEILRSGYMVRRLKRDVLSDLPMKTQTIIEVEVDLEEYAEAETDFLGHLEQTEGRAARDRAAKAEELSKMNHLRRLAGRLKVPAITRWLKDYFESTDGKLMVGACHKKVTYPLVYAFKKRAVLVDGDLGHEAKQAAFDRFNLDSSCELLVGNYDAAGTGWSCRSTSTVAVCEFPWRPDQLYQFISRIEGLERGLPGTAALVYHFVARGTIDEDLCRVLHSKQRMAEQALDAGRETEGESVYDLVKRMTKERAEARRGKK